MRKKVSAEDRVREIRRKRRKKYSSGKTRIVFEGLRGEEGDHSPQGTGTRSCRSGTVFIRWAPASSETRVRASIDPLISFIANRTRRPQSPTVIALLSGKGVLFRLCSHERL